MKIRSNTPRLLFLLFWMTGLSLVHSQIGVGTATPQGAVDLEGGNYGLLFPRVALNGTTDTTTITNPNGGPPVAGTVVFNTQNTTTGSNDVQIGIYAFDGSSWMAQFTREDYTIYKQTGGCQRAAIQEGTPLTYSTGNAISGLVDQLFIPEFSGRYRIEVKTNFGAGKIEDFTTGDESVISLATSEGAFFFKLQGAGGIDINPDSASYDYQEGWSYTHSYSSENDRDGTSIESYNIPHHATLVYYLYLIGGETYTFNLRHKTVTGQTYFQNNGVSGDGMGHIGHDLPCSVEFQFIGD
ncbi:MAG: hypothetical protein P8I32_05560 [Flavobacteriaceae bacterium]|nr:hypothetical protein [Flavobacteriaceae bacterium]